MQKDFSISVFQHVTPPPPSATSFSLQRYVCTQQFFHYNLAQVSKRYKTLFMFLDFLKNLANFGEQSLNTLIDSIMYKKAVEDHFSYIFNDILLFCFMESNYCYYKKLDIFFISPKPSFMLSFINVLYSKHLLCDCPPCLTNSNFWIDQFRPKIVLIQLYITILCQFLLFLNESCHFKFNF